MNPNPETPPLSLAERMYPDAPAPDAGTVADTGTESPQSVDASRTRACEERFDPPPISPDQPDDQISVERLIDRPASVGERAYGEAQAPESPEGYAKSLSAFDTIEVQPEESEALAAGRAEAAAALCDMRVPPREAEELSSCLTGWHAKEAMSLDQLYDAQERSMAILEREWGMEAKARIALAQRAADEACKRLPWLRGLLQDGAGNDPAVIRRFAEIGLRNARRAKR